MNKKEKKQRFYPIVFFAIGIICCLVVVYYLVPWITGKTQSWGTSELMAAIAIVAVMVSISAPVLDHLFAARRDGQFTEWADQTINQYVSCKSTVYSIDIGVRILENNHVLFSASIENVGDNIIETIVANLYIDQGIRQPLVNSNKNGNNNSAAWYEFPFILEHQQTVNGRPDCILCTKCIRDNTSRSLKYPEEIVKSPIEGKEGLLRTSIKLRHLSDESIKYINPKEKFSEDVVCQFQNPGVYRVTLFVGAAGDADCACATKQFYIPDKRVAEFLEQDQL